MKAQADCERHCPVSGTASSQRRQIAMDAGHIKPFGRISFTCGVAVAALGALLAWAPPARAQHSRGGHAGVSSGGHSGGFSGGQVGRFSGSFHGGFSAPRSFSGSAASAPRGFGGRMPLPAPRYGFTSQRRPFAGAHAPNRRPPDRGGWDHRDHHRARYRGFGFVNPYLYARSWQLLPWDLGYPDFTDFWGADSPSYDGGAAEANYAQAQPPAAEQDPAPPEAETYRPSYRSAMPSAPTVNQAPAAPAPQNEPQLTLIFNDGHTQAIRNYMLTSRDLIVMDDAALGRESRIPLSELNLPATQRAARQAGLDFSPPPRNPS